MKLDTQERKRLPKKDFAVKGGHYPIEDKSHARNALARVSEFGSSSEKAEVRQKVERKFPSIDEKKKSVARKMTGHKQNEREVRSKKAGFYVHGHKNYGDVYEE
jgi:hypothetical protein